MTQENEWIRLERDDQLEEGGRYHVYAVYHNGDSEEYLGERIEFRCDVVLQCGCLHVWRDGNPNDNYFSEIHIQKIPKPAPPVILDLPDRERKILEFTSAAICSPYPDQLMYLRKIKSILTGGAE